MTAYLTTLSVSVSICQYLPLILKWASCCRGAEEEHETLRRYVTGTAHYVFLFTRHEGMLWEWSCNSFNSQPQHWMAVRGQLSTLATLPRQRASSTH